MTAKRDFGNMGGKLCCLYLMMVPLALMRPAEAKGTFTVLPAGTVAWSINDSGVVTGTFTEDDGTVLGFLRTPDGAIADFRAAKNTTHTVPQGINNAGDVTGYYYVVAEGRSRGFVRHADGTIIAFDGPGGGQNRPNGTTPMSINAQGVITGYYSKGEHQFGFVRAVDGTITSFDIQNAGFTIATGINDKGEIAGLWYDATIDHGFVRSADGTITSFDAPGATLGTDGDAINNKGAVTGTYGYQPNVSHGYIRQPDGTFTTFDAGPKDTYPMAINAKGTVAGIGDSDEIGSDQSFVRAPNGNAKKIIAPRPNGGTDARGINKDGVVVGSFTVYSRRHNSYTYYGFIWTP